jgi:hypothetical protein
MYGLLKLDIYYANENERTRMPEFPRTYNRYLVTRLYSIRSTFLVNDAETSCVLCFFYTRSRLYMFQPFQPERWQQCTHFLLVPDGSQPNIIYGW